MSRWAMLFVFTAATTGATFTTDAAVGSDIAAAPHYKYRGTGTDGAPVPPPVERDPDALFTPSLPYIPIAPFVVERPWLPGSSTLPGYYGSSHSYEYQGPYYGGPGTVSTWNRLPYACGVYGYC
jgi:hypothetical protein